MNRLMLKCGVAIVLSALSGCYQLVPIEGPSKTVVKEVTVEREAPPPPGVVQYIWEEPMVDVVDVPPGLDPEGHYWRPGHQEVVEIRQGKWRHYRSPDSN